MSRSSNTADLLDRLRQVGDWTPYSEYNGSDQQRINFLNRANLVARKSAKRKAYRPDGNTATVEVAYYKFIPLSDVRSVQLLSVLHAVDQPISLTNLQKQFKAKPWGSLECIRMVISYAEIHGLVEIIKAGQYRLFVITALGREYLQHRESAA